MTDSAQRYTTVAVVLHWAIAYSILANLLAGWWMTEAIDDPATKAHAIAVFQLHKSLGLVVLLLSVLRLLWRLTHRPPALPAGMPMWERFAAKATHWAFYALMIVVPLSGWTYVSAQWGDNGPLNVPTIFFGLFKVPHLFDAHAMTDEARKAVAERNMEAHELLAYAMAGLFVLHVLAALKHHFVNRDAVLKQMAPVLDPAAPVSAGIRAGIALVFTGLIAFGWAALREPGSTSSTAAPGGTATSAAGSWVVEAGSKIEFTGSNAGAEFRGIWTKWNADIRWDAANPEASTITATVDTASAQTGVQMQEEALPQEEWFNVAKFPTAEFKSTKIGADGAIEGTLTIKGHALPITGLRAAVDNGVLKISGHTEVDRKAADLGMQSDATGEYVSLKIGVDVNVTATEPVPEKPGHSH